MTTKKQLSKKEESPFIRFLKDFSKDRKLVDLLSFRKFLKRNPKNTMLVVTLTEDRRAIFKNTDVILVNDNYSSLGSFYLAIENLYYEDGILYFYPTETTIIEDSISFGYRSRKHLYRLINRFEKLGVNNIEDLATALKKE